jgi:hypothetical protein
MVKATLPSAMTQNFVNPKQKFSRYAHGTVSKNLFNTACKRETFLPAAK